MRRIRKALENPFLLIAEGFLAGAILFWAVTPETSSAAASTAETEAAALLY